MESYRTKDRQSINLGSKKFGVASLIKFYNFLLCLLKPLRKKLIKKK